MKIKSLFNAPGLIALALFLVISATAQRPSPTPKTSITPVVFAVIDDGKTIEPITGIGDGKFVAPDTSGDAAAWGAKYYKSKTSYPLIFGGAPSGSVSIVKSNIGTECGGASAEVLAKSPKAKYAGMLMGLATNLKLKPGVTGYRMRPTAEQRTAVEELVRAEFKKHGVTAAPLKTLRFHNLTALDVDGDGKPEFVGSYWIAPTKNERRTLFFITEGEGESMKLGVADYALIKPEDVMSSDLTDIDKGFGNELLLDVLDVDQDGVAEIFTIGKAFEGNNYYAYKRSDGKWTKVHDTYVYRCAF